MTEKIVERSAFPGAKLLDPTKYGNEEYLIVALFGFILFVAIKHLIFHTIYFWWFQHGRFYIPNTLWTILTGKTLSKRLLNHVSTSSHGNDLNGILNVMDEYFKNKEFAPSLGETKGKVVDEVLEKHKPNSVLIIGCHLGYCLLRILKSLPDNATVFVIEENAEFIATSKQLVAMTKTTIKVTYMCGNAKDLLSTLHCDYGVEKLDFIFLNRISHEEPSHLPLVHLLEGNSENTHSFVHQSGNLDNSKRTVMLADKVVMPGDPSFLKYVRESDHYETKYYQMSLEHSSHEIVDGMEVAIYTGS
uniref:catechol O-methyltransferase n=1 Tax=Phallusia mammillata TaxID=59560 RepID=A0A6F9DK85_9ASCI|nr:catechol O-methyltransferase-like [Phallusia mammillata]